MSGVIIPWLICKRKIKYTTAKRNVSRTMLKPRKVILVGISLLMRGVILPWLFCEHEIRYDSLSELLSDYANTKKSNTCTNIAFIEGVNLSLSDLQTKT